VSDEEIRYAYVVFRGNASSANEDAIAVFDTEDKAKKWVEMDKTVGWYTVEYGNVPNVNFYGDVYIIRGVKRPNG